MTAEEQAHRAIDIIAATPPPHATGEIILVIEAKGEVVSSNFSQFADMVRARLGEINRDLATDDDFDQADADAKAIAGAEASLKAAKEKALADAEQLHALFESIDWLSAELAAARLDLASQIRKRKEALKEDIVEEFLAAFDIDPRDARRQFLGGMQTAIKGKRTVDGMRSACRAYQCAKQAAILASREVLDRFEAKFGTDMIPDRAQLELSSAEMVEAELIRRIQAKKATEEAAKLREEADVAKAIAVKAQVALAQAQEIKALNGTNSDPPHAQFTDSAIEVGSELIHQPTEQEEWQAFKSAVLSAFVPLKATRGALVFPKNIARAQLFSNALNSAWQEVAL